MTSFAHNTSQADVEDYYRRMPRSLGGYIPDDQHAHGVPNTGQQPSSWYSTGSWQQQSRPAGQGLTRRQKPAPGAGGASPAVMGWPDQSYPSKPGPGRPSVPTLRPSHSTPPSRPAPILRATDSPIVPMKPGGGRSPDAAVTPAYQPGKAQPNAPKSQGTPYGVFNGGSDLAAPPSPPPPNGNMAYAQPDMRPQPFQAAYQGFDGSFSGQPNYGQRDAFIQQINNQLGQMQAQSWQNPGMGPPQFNFPQMWGQAGNMVQQGWQNPLAGLAGAGDLSPAGVRAAASGSLPPPPPGWHY